MKNKEIDPKFSRPPFPYEVYSTHAHYRCPRCEKRVYRFLDEFECGSCGQRLNWTIIDFEIPEEIRDENIKTYMKFYSGEIKWKEYCDLKKLLAYRLYAKQFKEWKKKSHKKQIPADRLHFFKRTEKKYGLVIIDEK